MKVPKVEILEFSEIAEIVGGPEKLLWVSYLPLVEI